MACLIVALKPPPPKHCKFKRRKANQLKDLNMIISVVAMCLSASIPHMSTSLLTQYHQQYNKRHENQVNDFVVST